MGLIENIRVAGTGQLVPADVVPCSFQDVVAWQRYIHDPFIRPGGGIGFDWDWPAYYLACNTLETAAGRQVTVFQIHVEGPGGQAVPVAQCLLSMPYAFPGAPKGGPDPQCVFVWYVSAAPVAALRQRGVLHKFATLAPVLDTAIQMSAFYGLGGRIGLHAARGRTESESQELVKRYLGHGLARRASGRGFWRFLARKEDGRLFYFDSAAALAYAANQDDLRPGP
ncbi:hypothetical protein [Ramlibacter alkalitolerans]|uniref:GNAT family N-acetyltransferase n=1 Tax=Ramlibacter alkalitolerans TaxID=2039631 RepID=A0ABS1JUG0_9BURK|nr:hypothetical protein [Ramlibacter alkalitolerans]MBL0427766.1 hypothetical protein [Ramlibacter alkalitolerans]